MPGTTTSRRSRWGRGVTREATEPIPDTDADRAIMAFIRESRKASLLPRVGPFALLLTDVTRLRFLNYGIPDDGADPDDAAVALLVAAFRTADRLPRVEFLPSVAPALEPVLASHGWTVEDRLPLMTCTTRTLRDLTPPEGILVQAPSDDVELLEMARLQHDAFGETETVDDRTVARLRGSLSRGARALVCVDAHTRRMVGAAQAGVPAGGATELVGVAVAASHRRRGLAATMVSMLTHQAFAAGLTTVFLEAAPGADGAYRNAGFERTSTSVHMSLGGDADA
jgi:ribosomal protein S18 acetylase RimI-like enzyme